MTGEAPDIPCLNGALKEVTTFWEVSLQGISLGQVIIFLSELPEEFISHAPLLRKLLGDVLHHIQRVNQERGRHTIQEKEDTYTQKWQY